MKLFNRVKSIIEAGQGEPLAATDRPAAARLVRRLLANPLPLPHKLAALVQLVSDFRGRYRIEAEMVLIWDKSVREIGGLRAASLDASLSKAERRAAHEEAETLRAIILARHQQLEDEYHALAARLRSNAARFWVPKIDLAPIFTTDSLEKFTRA